MSDNEGHFVGGRWIPGGGAPLESINPSTGAASWRGNAASNADIDAAFVAARSAAQLWCDAPMPDRVALLEAVADQFRQRKAELADAISTETGKPRWESNAEVDLMIAKVAISIDAARTRCAPMLRENAPATAGATAATRYRPHGVMAVLGPFNMPGHLPNGHIIPAILAGNAVVYKASEQAARVGHRYAQAWQAALATAAAPAGLFNLLQAGAPVGAALAGHRQLDGLLFTGSAAAGKAISRTLADRPGVIVALEMGGNNPLIVDEPSDLHAAAYLTVQSAYLTAGQRCSCARRLIVPAGMPGDAFVDALVKMIGRIRVGLPDDLPEPFMGPVISAAAADRLLAAQATLLARGGKSLVEMKRLPRSPALLSPGLIDVTAIPHRDDTEHFGPLLQLIRVPDFQAALAEANATRYGLSAGFVSDSQQRYDAFFRQIRAGVVNWNRPLTGASSASPFGGIGDSGNHRPSAYFAADYCAYPVASLESPQLPPLPASIVGLQP